MPVRSATCPLWVLWVLIAACSTPSPQQHEIRAELRPAHLDTSSAIATMAYRPARLIDGVPDIDPPESFRSSTSKHLLLRLGEAFDSIVVVLEPAEQKLVASRLSDGQPVEWVHGRPSKAENGPPSYVVDLPGNDSTAYGLESILLRPARSVMLVRRNDFRMGQITVGDTALAVALLPYALGEDYSNRSSVKLRIDLNRDGIMQTEAWLDSSGVWHPGEEFSGSAPFVLQGEAYEVAEIAADGTSLALRRSSRRHALDVVGLRAPNLPLVTLDGDSLQLSDFRGRFVVLNWWATTCAPCIEEMPGLNELAARYPPEEVAFIAIADDEPPVLREFLEDHPFDYVQAIASDTVRRHIGGAYPKHIMIDEDGRVVYYAVGGALDRHEDLARAIEALRTI